MRNVRESIKLHSRQSLADKAHNSEIQRLSQISLTLDRIRALEKTIQNAGTFKRWCFQAFAQRFH
jgi:hypothetical protein